MSDEDSDASDASLFESGSQHSPRSNYDVDGFHDRIIDDEDEQNNDDSNKENENLEEEPQEKLTSLSIKQKNYEKGYSDAEKVLNSHILILCSSLGGINPETKRYDLGIDALSCLKDLKRWIKKVDTETNTWHVASACDDNKLVINDLIPILTQLKPSQESSDNYNTLILLATLELLVSLTSPLMLDTEKASDVQLNLYIKLKKAQVLYKHKLLNFESGKSLKTVVQLALPILAMKSNERTTRDMIILNLCLHLFRNVIRIEPPELTVFKKSSSSKTQQANDNMPAGILKDDVSHDSVVLTFKRNKVFKLIQTITAGLGSEYPSQILSNVCFECYFYLTYGLDHKELINNVSPTVYENNNATQPQLPKPKTELAELYTKDKNLHNDVLRKKQMSRHANFGTMMSIRQADGTSITMSGQNKLGNSDIIDALDSKKTQIKSDRYAIRKNESTKSDFDTNLSSIKSKNLSIAGKKIMIGFCSDFVEAGFNTIISIIRKQIMGHSSSFLEFHFFSVISWILKFERLRREANENDLALKLRFGYIEQALSQETIRLVLKNNLPRYLDQAEYNLLRVAVQVFKEMLMVSVSMHQLIIPENAKTDTQYEIESYIKSSEGVLRNIFDNQISVDILFKVPQDAHKVSFKHMDEMIEYVHVFSKALKYLTQLKDPLAIEKKRRAKVNTVNIDKHIEFGDSEDEEIYDAVSNSHSFIKFDKEQYKIFERRLLHEKIVNTYVAFFSKFDELNETQIRRCLSYFNKILLKDEHFLKLTRLDFMLILHDLKNAKLSESLMKELYKVLSYFMSKLEKLFRVTKSMGIELITTNQNPDVMIRRYLLTGDVNLTEDESKNKKKITKYRFVEPQPGTMREAIELLVSALVYKDEIDLLNELKSELDRVVENRLFLLSENSASLEPVKFPDTPVYFKSSKFFHINGLFVFLLDKIGLKLDGLSIKSFYVPSSLNIDLLKEVSEILDHRSRNPIDNDTVASSLEMISEDRSKADVDAYDYDFHDANENQRREDKHTSTFDDFADDDNDGFVVFDNAGDATGNEDILDGSGALDNLDRLESKMLSSRIPKGKAVRKGESAKLAKKNRNRKNRVLDSDDDDLNELLPAKKRKRSDKDKSKKKRHRSQLPTFDGSDAEQGNVAKETEKEKAHLSSKYVVDSDDDSDEEFFLRESRLQQAMRNNDGKPLSADQFSAIFSTVKKKAEAAASTSAITSMPFLGLDEPLSTFKPYSSAAFRSDEDDDSEDDALSDASRADSGLEDNDLIMPTQTQGESNENEGTSQYHNITLTDIMKNDIPTGSSPSDSDEETTVRNHKKVRILDESDDEE